MRSRKRRHASNRSSRENGAFAHRHERVDRGGELQVAEQLLHDGVDLGAHHLGRVVLEDLALRLDRVGERRVRGVAVGQASPHPPVEEARQPLDVGGELRDEPRLADAGRAHDRHERRPSRVLGLLQGLLEDRELLVAADQPGFHAEGRPLAAALGGDRAGVPGGHGFGLALQRERRQLAEVDHVLHRCVDRRSDHDVSRVGGGLQASRGVHRVAREHAVVGAGGALQVDQHLAGLDADAHRELRLALAGERPVQLAQHRLHLEGRTHGALGVVLVGLRDAEHGEHRVAHELLEVSPVARDLLRQPIERAAHDRLHDLGVFLLGERGRADEVGEQRRRELPLHATRRRLGVERRRAREAEPGAFGVLLAARRARSHRWRDYLRVSGDERAADAPCQARARRSRIRGGAQESQACRRAGEGRHRAPAASRHPTAIPMLILAAISIMMLLVDIAIASDTDLEGSTIVSALVYGASRSCSCPRSSSSTASRLCLGLRVVAALAGTISAFVVETSPTGSLEQSPSRHP